MHQATPQNQYLHKHKILFYTRARARTHTHTHARTHTHTHIKYKKSKSPRPHPSMYARPCTSTTGRDKDRNREEGRGGGVLSTALHKTPMRAGNTQTGSCQRIASSTCRLLERAAEIDAGPVLPSPCLEAPSNSPVDVDIMSCDPNAQ